MQPSAASSLGCTTSHKLREHLKDGIVSKADHQRSFHSELPLDLSSTFQFQDYKTSNLPPKLVVETSLLFCFSISLCV